MRRAMYRCNRVLGCAAIWLALPAWAAAQDAAPVAPVPAAPEISLRDALQHAQRDVPAVAAAAATYALREAERGAVTSAWLPALTVSGKGGYSFDNRLI